MASIKNISKWGFVSGRISVLEARFLPREFYLGIIAQERPEEIIPHLQETFLREYLTPGAVWDDFSALADRCFHDMALSIRADCPSPVVADMFLLPGDYLNLKEALSGKTDFPFQGGTFSLEKLTAIAHGEYGEIPGSVTEGWGWFSGEALDAGLGIMDIVLDGAYLRHLLALAAAAKSEMISTYVNDRVATHVTALFWRALNQGLSPKPYQQHLLPLGEFTSMTVELAGLNNVEAWPPVVGGAVGDALFQSLEFERDEQVYMFDMKATNHLTRLAGDGKLQTAAPERVFAFLAGLRVEMENLKLVVSGKLNRIDPDVLKERLKDCYV